MFYNFLKDSLLSLFPLFTDRVSIEYTYFVAIVMKLVFVNSYIKYIFSLKKGLVKEA